MNVLIFIAALPVVLICMYVYKKDVEKEPKSLLRKLMLWGVFSIIPVVIVEFVLDNFFEITGQEDLITLFLYCFIAIALIEETAKWIISYKVVYKDSEFNETYDAIVYSVFASLGFALIENILYVMSNGFLTGLLRAFTSVPAHTCTGIMMGYYMGLSKVEELNNNKSLSNRYMFYSLLIPSLIHTMYDTLAFSKASGSLAEFIIFTALLYVISLLIVKKVSNNNVKFNNSISYNDENYKYAKKSIIIIAVVVLIFSFLIEVIK